MQFCLENLLPPPETPRATFLDFVYVGSPIFFFKLFFINYSNVPDYVQLKLDFNVIYLNLQIFRSVPHSDFELPIQLLLY